MKSAEFLSAVKAMQGLLPEHVEQLTMLAPNLTDEQRDQICAQLQEENKGVVEGQQELLKVTEDGIKELQDFSKKELPKLRNIQEKSEEQEELESAEAQLNAGI